MTEHAMRRALARARDGKALDAAEAEVLLGARGADLETLCAAATRVRDAAMEQAGRPRTVTWSRKVFVPLTRLCRDRCHYCTFATTPGRVEAPYLSPDEVLVIARTGAEQGCKEALFTLGDRPEERWPTAREWLDSKGYDDTLAYVRAMAILVLEETGLLPHLNPGVLSWSELQRLRPVAPSMGLMLESTATALTEPGGPHFGSPDKDPAVRLRVIEDAGRIGIPFTTGILVGIGETPADRVESILAIRRLAREHHHVQEVIVQNFRAKEDTAMRAAPDADLEDHLATIAVTRLLLGPSTTVQAPPNLSEIADCERLLAAGVDDWGGVSPVTPDHVNPERPWPEVEVLRAATARAGLHLRERLTAHPRYVRGALQQDRPWLDPRLHPHVRALADETTGLAREDARPRGLTWQEPDGGLTSGGRTDLHRSIDTTGRTGDRRSDFDEVYGDWAAVGERAAAAGRSATAAGDHEGARDAGDEAASPAYGPQVVRPTEARAALARAEADPAGLSDEDYLALLTCDGDDLEQVTRLADALRRQVVGDPVTYVVNRNINFTNVCYVGCRFCAFAQRKTDADAFTLSLDDIAQRVTEAAALGATEVCLQGGISPDLRPGDYAAIVRTIKAAAPDIHVHAFSPMEIATAAAKAGQSPRAWLQEVKDAGLDSIPGTAAEILDDEVRWVLTKGKLPTAQWLEIVQTAHELGIPSSSTMMYGHVDHPRHWVGHLRTLAALQDRTGGFTEFVPLPFVHTNAPVYLAGIARPGPTLRDNRAVHAVARILLHGRIDHVQTSWVKLGVDGTRLMLTGGADDLGGTLMEETISRMAGSEHGSAKTVAELREITDGIGRPLRARTTTYA
ncbi:bifunctional FO biosynthesis protein CofGH [Arsenicicoccus dermatophilus]|uniref:bifunctional FO biosynthesis protein CofGH n=1 Tax=Arsenicicoccus dermatophilus TaxID=1076331 RepID=UPI001F4D25E8|nr:bifunctional FO biosynthesis protein CofGH [Arsenicicoccus dermatophilus]MCH8611681.1 bifunctional FO biosynthesis protein CofGH [Arsenicicoccus dermatophilus]